MEELGGSSQSIAILHTLAGDIKTAVGRIASHLESETRYRDSIGDRFEKISNAIWGNGKPGLIRDADKLKIEVERQKEDISQIRADVKSILAKIEDGMKWIIITLLLIVGRIVWEFSSFYVKGLVKAPTEIVSSRNP